MYNQLNYYYENRERYLNHYAQKIKCPICSLEMRLSSLNPHMQTKKCRYYKEYGYFKPLKKDKHKIKRERMKPDDFIVRFD